MKFTFIKFDNIADEWVEVGKKNLESKEHTHLFYYELHEDDKKYEVEDGLYLPINIGVNKNEKLKLPKTAGVFREELERKNNIQRIEKSLASNPLVNTLMLKLEAPKTNNKKLQKEESKLQENNILNSKSNLSMLETKIFKKD